jgi:hypothetical protein
MRTFHGFAQERSALEGDLKDTACLAYYSVTEGQHLNVPSDHPELRSRAGTVESSANMQAFRSFQKKEVLSVKAVFARQDASELPAILHESPK